MRLRTGYGRDLHDLDAGTGQDRFKRPGELPGPVSDQEPEARGSITQIHQQVADLLHGPRPVRVRCDTEDVHVTRADLYRVRGSRLVAGRAVSGPLAPDTGQHARLQ
jgi:hypothetical protein